MIHILYRQIMEYKSCSFMKNGFLQLHIQIDMFQCYLSYFILLADILNCTSLKTGEFLQYSGFIYFHQSLQYFLQFKIKWFSSSIILLSNISQMRDRLCFSIQYTFSPVQSSDYMYFNGIYILMAYIDNCTTQTKLQTKIYKNIFI